MKILNVILFLVVLVIGDYALSFIPYYDTDDDLNEIRSGMSLYTDHLTGCQYLKAGFFGSGMPRLNGAGEHIGCISK